MGSKIGILLCPIFPWWCNKSGFGSFCDPADQSYYWSLVISTRRKSRPFDNGCVTTLSTWRSGLNSSLIPRSSIGCFEGANTIHFNAAWKNMPQPTPYETCAAKTCLFEPAANRKSTWMKDRNCKDMHDKTIRDLNVIWTMNIEELQFLAILPTRTHLRAFGQH